MSQEYNIKATPSYTQSWEIALMTRYSMRQMTVSGQNISIFMKTDRKSKQAGLQNSSTFCDLTLSNN